MEELPPQTAADYRKMAQTCIELAEKADDSDIRASWLALASRWERMAEALDKNQTKKH